MNERDERFMREAIREARAAARQGEVPVGTVIVRGGEIIARGRNCRETKGDALGHAEIVAMRRASRKTQGWRLDGCELFVTLEPCPMCAGAIINARIDRVVFGAFDPKAGAAGSVTDLFAMPFNHRPDYLGGVLADECGDMLSAFFSTLRRAGAEKAAGR